MTEMTEFFNLKVKVCLAGDSFVGKTCLVRRYVMDMFDHNYISTFGTKVSKKRIIIKKENSDINLTFSIWDIIGKDSFKKIYKMAFVGSKGAIIVCDITKEDSLNNLSRWVTRVKKVTGEIPFVIVANKSDLTDKHMFKEADLQSFSKEIEVPFYITSAKNGDNVIKTFFKLGDLVIESIFNECS